MLEIFVSEDSKQRFEEMSKHYGHNVSVIKELSRGDVKSYSIHCHDCRKNIVTVENPNFPNYKEE